MRFQTCGTFNELSMKVGYPFPKVHEHVPWGLPIHFRTHYTKSIYMRIK